MSKSLHGALRELWDARRNAALTDPAGSLPGRVCVTDGTE